MLFQENCYCPRSDLSNLYQDLQCPVSYDQIEDDLSMFPIINMDYVSTEAISRFFHQDRHSLSHYKIIDNKVHVAQHSCLISI